MHRLTEQSPSTYRYLSPDLQILSDTVLVFNNVLIFPANRGSSFVIAADFSRDGALSSRGSNSASGIFCSSSAALTMFTGVQGISARRIPQRAIFPAKPSDENASSWNVGTTSAPAQRSLAQYSSGAVRLVQISIDAPGIFITFSTKSGSSGLSVGSPPLTRTENFLPAKVPARNGTTMSRLTSGLIRSRSFATRSVVAKGTGEIAPWRSLNLYDKASLLEKIGVS